jgi:transcription elongation GreA/GreB family factor
MGLQELKAAPQRIEYALVIGVVVRYLDDNKMTTFTLSRERHDPINGILSVASPLGSRLIGRVEEDETEVEADGRSRPVLIVRTDRPAATMH